MRDSGIGSVGNGYGLVPAQTGRRKRHAEEGSLGGGYTEVKRNSLESQDLESISSDSDSQEVSSAGMSSGPRMTCVRTQHVVNSRSVKESVRGYSCLVQRSGAR